VGPFVTGPSFHEDTGDYPRIDWSVFDGVRCVFWICGDHETESVTWDRADGKMTPCCDRCGKAGDPQ
jgi:hypothetical protein